MRLLSLALLLLAITGCSETAPPRPPAAETSDSAAGNTVASAPVLEKIPAEHLPNAIRIHSKVISGGLPDGDIAFQELKDLGVKTVISVDGAKPDVATAKKFGLKYVHLPHGYDGIPEDRLKELAKAVRDLDGPIYLHCHHGKHRSPAAASAACVGAGLIQHGEVDAILKLAGTSPKYRGLFESAESAAPFEKQLLDTLAANFPETAKLPAMAEAMIGVEHAHDHLKLIAGNGWKTPADHPALEPAHEALLLREHFTELLRTEDVKARPEGFQSLVRDSEQAAQEVETALEEWTKAGQTEPAPKKISESFERVTKLCAECHQKFRDVPLSEKTKRK